MEVVQLIKADMYLSAHARYYMREVRVLVYSQVSSAQARRGTAGHCWLHMQVAGKARQHAVTCARNLHSHMLLF